MMEAARTSANNCRSTFQSYVLLPSLMMEAVRTSETSVDNYFTRQYIPEDSFELHTRRCENLKYHNIKTDLQEIICH
jgi:hypothetical protein